MPATGAASREGTSPIDADAIECWIFDLDNTLYPAHCRLFAQVEARIRLYVQNLLGLDAAAAFALQKRYFRDHMTTLNGLIHHHGVAPQDFLTFVHDIDYSPIVADPALDAALARLAGRKIVFTNGSTAHAEEVLARLGIARHFAGIFDIAAAGFRPKPDPAPYRRLIETFAILPERALMADDMARNLEPAARLGMKTVLIASEAHPPSVLDPVAGDLDFVDVLTHDLSAWLAELDSAHRHEDKKAP